MKSTSKPNLLRMPPQSIDSEKAVLGSIMMRQGALFDISDVITPECFYAEKHRIIYQGMLDLSVKNEPIDLVSLTTKLKEKKQLESVGGSSYLTELIGMVPSSTNVKHYAEIVHKKFKLRSIIEAADAISEYGFTDNEMEIETTLDMAEKKIFEVTGVGQKQKFVNIKKTLAETWEELERLHEAKGELRGVPTGFPDLDNLLAGLQNSDLIILAARPSMGKTTLALDIARNAATKYNVPVGIFSLEMSSHQLTSRLLSAESRVNAWSLRTGKNLKETDFTLIRDSLDRLAKAPIYIDDQAGNTIGRMRAAARRLKSEHGLGLLVVDYLQLMMTAKSYDSMVNQVTDISRSLKQLARELNIPVLALSQLSRAVEARGGKPRLSDLRDSGSIEQDADIVMFIHQEDRYKDESEKTHIAEILVEKHRNGPIGRVELYFDPTTTTFLPLDKSGYMKSDVVAAGDSLDEF